MPKIGKWTLCAAGLVVTCALSACERNVAWGRGIERPALLRPACPEYPAIEAPSARRSLLLIVAGVRGTEFSIHAIDTEKRAIYTGYASVSGGIPMALMARIAKDGAIEISPAPGSPEYTGRALSRVEWNTRGIARRIAAQRCVPTGELERIALEAGVRLTSRTGEATRTATHPSATAERPGPRRPCPRCTP
jgi:hypothetical protein